MNFERADYSIAANVTARGAEGTPGASASSGAAPGGASVSSSAVPPHITRGAGRAFDLIGCIANECKTDPEFAKATAVISQLR